MVGTVGNLGTNTGGLGMVSHKMSILTIFSKNFNNKFDIRGHTQTT